MFGYLRLSREDRGSMPNQGEECFKSIFDHVSVAIAQTDLNGRFVLSNPAFCELVGRSTDALSQLTMQDITHPEDLSRTRELFEKLIAGELKFATEQRYIHSDGSPVWVNSSVSLLKDAAGKPLAAIAAAQDITTRKRSEERWRQDAQELERQLIASGRLVSLGELTASMAHEFNNPLGIVLGFTQDLLGDMEPSAPNYKFIQIIDEEAKRCQKVVQDLLDFASPRSADFIRTDVNEVMKRTLDMVSSRLSKQKVEAIMQTAPDLPSVHADPQQLQQLLANLCLNALDAMPDGGKLMIAAEIQAPERLKITVSDTGFGMDAGTLDRIFQPFFTAKKRKGLGLGLPVCEQIIKAHGGSIEVQSLPNKGATFRVYLPTKS
jgi:PAS domain S-box-containing protein